MRKRKGTVGDLALMLVALVILTIVAISLYKVMVSIRSTAGETDGLNIEALDYGVAGLKNLDFAIGLLVVFFIIGLAASAYALRTTPIAIPFFLFLAIAVVLLGAWFSNMFFQTFTSSDIATQAQQFTITTTIFSRLPLILAGAGLLILGFLFFKPQIGGG